MKHSFRNNKNILYVSVMVLILALVFTSVVMAAPAQAEKSVRDTVNIKAVIKDYFTQRYEAQKALVKPTGYSSIYSFVIENADPVWLQREKDRLEILLTIAETTHFNFTAYKFSLVYQGITVSKNQATVTLLENNELSYPGSSEPSLLGDLAHTITLKKNASGAWRITKDDYLDDTLRSMEGVTKADVLNTIHTNILAAQKMQMSLSNDAMPEKLDNLPDNSVPQQLATYPYVPSRAVGYADANWNRPGVIPGYVTGIPGWQSNWLTSYKFYTGSGPTGDCTNFASQAIFMGADYTASDANYFYPDHHHYGDWWYYKFSTDANGSYAWVNVEKLYTFLTETNVKITTQGRGPYGVARGTPAINGYAIAPGDPILMKNAAGAWRHTVIVRARATNYAYPPYAWVDAHSNNVRNVPLANYLIYTWFPVHIQGYRE